MAKKGHIVEEEDGTIWQAMLNQADIAENHNKFYRIELIQDDTSGAYFVWNRWGRVGFAGQNKLFQHSSLGGAKDDFKKKYKQKTGNEWGAKKFVRKTNKYFPIEIDYGAAEDEDEAQEKKDKKPKEKPVIPPSQLPEAVQALIRLIADVRAMEAYMAEMDIDVERFPLGRLTKRHIREGYEILKRIAEAIKGRSDRDDLTELSNEFYTYIPPAPEDRRQDSSVRSQIARIGPVWDFFGLSSHPPPSEYAARVPLFMGPLFLVWFWFCCAQHAFGMRRLPTIDSDAKLQKKMSLMEALGDMEIAQRVLSDAKQGPAINPIDQKYEALHTLMQPLPPGTERFELIKRMVTNTHAPTHTAYTLAIEDIFDVSRAGESERFVPWAENPNRMLLWHGSRVTNFMGILSQGLRIAPPEAPVTGYMFGKGVYFADMVSKSANYCSTSPTSNTGILLLCEVALGDLYERTAAEYMDQAPAPYLSTWGRGTTIPDPAGEIIIEDGLKVPTGVPKDITLASSLRYNEFIVYNTDQVKIRYLVKLKFNYPDNDEEED
ncbi:putative polymerase family [Paratrimastix pyriformis]|uniref:Poly [ADP-ribose] polymerase n=1 Tax=Paratrimastix pyriformis TaxID=342808 RepID=A0ABQ8UHS5_9EUKA|nr:putative polymerase family [Paratrimastix pyriformis]